jgi:hypothetical protein
VKKRKNRSKHVNKKKKSCGKHGVSSPKSLGDSSPSTGNMSATDPPADDVKMSETILTLAEPLLQKYGKNFERIHGILNLAMTAWNLSMLPEPTEEKIVTEITGSLPEEFSAEDVAALLKTVYMLMNRKRELFQDLQEVITKIDLRKTEIGFDLTVFSAPVQASEESSVGNVAD